MKIIERGQNQDKPTNVKKSSEIDKNNTKVRIIPRLETQIKLRAPHTTENCRKTTRNSSRSDEI